MMTELESKYEMGLYKGKTQTQTIFFCVPGLAGQNLVIQVDTREISLSHKTLLVIFVRNCQSYSNST